MNMEFNPQKIADIIQAIPNVKELEAPKSFAQRQKLWETEIGNQKVSVTLVYSMKDDELGGSLGAALIRSQ